MRRVTWLLLLLFAFAAPWEYSLDFGAPWGNVARLAGLLALLAAVPAILQDGRMHTPGAFCQVTLALFLWFCCTYFWSADPAATLGKTRAYFQAMMIVWLVGEFAGSAADLRNLLRAVVAGSWVLALLTLAAYRSPEAIASQFRIAAYGQDPNDVARFLVLGLPAAALLARCEGRRAMRLSALVYLPAATAAVLLTGSRGGFLAAVVALAGSAILLAQGQGRRFAAGAFVLPPFLAALWLLVPRAAIERLATIPEQLHGGDLNQRLNIWSAGWRAFEHAPVFGSGAGAFVTAARLSPIDTAHNTALSVLVDGGLCALFLAVLLVVLAVRAALCTRGGLRLALMTTLAVWAVTSVVATVEASRMTWLLGALTALAGRFAEETPAELETCFPAAPWNPEPVQVPRLAEPQEF
jgi:O-antigen ligase